MPIWVIVLLVVAGIVVIGGFAISISRHHIEPSGFGEGPPTPPPR